jgi:hypothetical protein
LARRDLAQTVDVAVWGQAFSRDESAIAGVQLVEGFLRAQVFMVHPGGMAPRCGKSSPGGCGTTGDGGREPLPAVGVIARMARLGSVSLAHVGMLLGSVVVRSVLGSGATPADAA